MVPAPVCASDEQSKTRRVAPRKGLLRSRDGSTLETARMLFSTVGPLKIKLLGGDSLSETEHDGTSAVLQCPDHAGSDGAPPSGVSWPVISKRVVFPDPIWSHRNPTISPRSMSETLRTTGRLSNLLPRLYQLSGFCVFLTTRGFGWSWATANGRSIHLQTSSYSIISS